MMELANGWKYDTTQLPLTTCAGIHAATRNTAAVSSSAVAQVKRFFNEIINLKDYT